VFSSNSVSKNPTSCKYSKSSDAFNSKPGFTDHPIPLSILTKEFSNIDDLVSNGILSKVEGATRNGLVTALNKSHTAGISPILRDLSRAGILFDPKSEGEYIIPKKEKPEPSGVKGRPTSEKKLVAKALASKFEADSDYEPNEEELAMFADKPDFIERLRSQVNGTLKRGPKNALKNAMQGLASFDDDTDGDGDVDNDDIKENQSNETGIPLTPEVKAYVDESLAELKASEDFEYLQDVGFFETEFEENTLLKFEDQYPNADNVSKEVHDYIQTKVYGDSNLNENESTEVEEKSQQEDYKKFENVWNSNTPEYLVLVGTDPIYDGLDKVVNDPETKQEAWDLTWEINSYYEEDGMIEAFAQDGTDYKVMSNFAPQLVKNLIKAGFTYNKSEDYWTVPNSYLEKLPEGRRDQYTEGATSYGIIWDFWGVDYDTSPREAISDMLDEAANNSNLNENKKPKLKIKKPLNEQFKRMQKLAGLITENENSEIKMYGDFTYLKMSADNLCEYLKNNFPKLASLEKCTTLIEFVEENIAQDREDEGEKMELVTMSASEFWNNFDNFYGKY